MNSDMASLNAQSTDTTAEGLVLGLQGAAQDEEPESSMAGEANTELSQTVKLIRKCISCNGRAAIRESTGVYRVAK